MEVKWIEDFLYLSEFGSFAKAAEARHITQPAFGRRIKQLEEWVGVDLVNRDTYPSSLTNAGLRFLQYAEELKKQIEYARLETIKKDDNNKSIITFHTQHVLSEYVVNKIIRTNVDIFKNTMIRVQPDHLHNAVQKFLNERAGFLIGYSFNAVRLYIPNLEVKATIIGHDSLIPVVALDKKGLPRYKDIKNTTVPLLSYPSEAFFAQVLDKNDSLEQCCCNFKIVYENAVTHSLKSMALSGYGVAWLPAGFVKRDIKAGRLAVFSKNVRPVPAEIKLYHFHSEELNPDIEALWNKMQLSTSISLKSNTKDVS